MYLIQIVCTQQIWNMLYWVKMFVIKIVCTQKYEICCTEWKAFQKLQQMFPNGCERKRLSNQYVDRQLKNIWNVRK